MKLIKRIRRMFVPWYAEKDSEVSFKRWLHETPNGRAGKAELQKLFDSIEADNRAYDALKDK